MWISPNPFMILTSPSFFLVEVRGFRCVMKVHLPKIGLPIDPHTCEVEAYRRLKARGICDKGWVPQFYGSIQNIQPEMWPERIAEVLEYKAEDDDADDEALPSAIFIEYIPGMQCFELETYTKDRMSRFIDIVKEMNAAHVLHDNIRSRNMMIAPSPSGGPERIVIIDFDRAQTFNVSGLSKEQDQRLAEEGQMMDDMAETIELDIAEGRLDDPYNNSYLYLYAE